MTAKRRDVHGGGFYGVTQGGSLVPVEAAEGDVTLWICRRVADYAPSPIPPGAAFAVCSRCDAPIAYNPARQVDAPKVCMQCARIQPLPIES